MKLVIIALLSFMRAEAMESCNIQPDDKGYAVLVKSVYDTNLVTIQMEKAAGLPETPTKNPPASVDLVKWCRCRHSQRLEKLGPTLTKLIEDAPTVENYLRWMKTLNQTQLVMHKATVSSIEATCYNLASSGSSTATNLNLSQTSKSEPPPTMSFETAMKTPLIAGKGFSGLEIGMPATKIQEVLGKAVQVITTKGSDEYHFGPNGAGLIITASPSGPNGVIVSVMVGPQYVEATDKGIRIKDDMTTVRKKMADVSLVASNPTELYYQSGILFRFSTSPVQLQTITVVAKTSAPGAPPHASVTPKLDFNELMGSTLSASGFPRLQIGASPQDVVELLGYPLNGVKKIGPKDFYNYGPTSTELQLSFSPPGPAGKLQSIVVNSSFKGATDKGVRIGDSVDVIKQKMGSDRLLKSGDRELLYDSGFIFNLDRSPRQAVMITVLSSADPNLEKLRRRKGTP